MARGEESAGILLWRRSLAGLEVLLVHPGGPYWRNKDAGAWTIPKGQLDPGEVLVVGDRADADAAGAAAAGMPCVIIGRRRPADPATQSCVIITTHERLSHVLDDDGR